MKHRIWILALSVLLILSLAVTTSAADKQFKLRWGHYLAKGPFVEVEEAFAKRIEERTNGRVKIAMTFAGGLGKGEELFRLAGRGAIDMKGMVAMDPEPHHAWYSGEAPLSPCLCAGIMLIPVLDHVHRR